MIIDENFKQRLKIYVENNPKIIAKKQSIKYPELYILKYTKKCFYKGIWNDYTKICRGLIIDKDYNIIVRPLEKIFNYGIEPQAPRIGKDEKVIITRKINGFFCAVKLYKDELLFSTTGSLDSNYCNMGREMILSNVNNDYLYERLSKDETLFFEIVHKDDPHIIPEEIGVYLIGSRTSFNNICLDFNIGNNDYGIKNVEYNFINFGELKEKIKTVTHEGYVIYGDNGICTKMKSPYYLVNKLFARTKNLNDLLKTNIKNKIDEEYFGLVDHIKKDEENFSLLSEQERLQYIRNYLNNINE